MESGETVTQALRASLAAAGRRAEDSAAERLALRYAELLDTDPEALPKVGPALLSVLDALLLTPRARARGRGQVSDGRQPPASPLDELRARRERRGQP
jgi:hypothetical protein